MHPVGTVVWRSKNGVWSKGYMVTAVDADARTYDLQGTRSKVDIKDVARDDVKDAAEIAELREAVKAVNADLDPTLARVLSKNDGDTKITDPRAATELSLYKFNFTTAGASSMPPVAAWQMLPKLVTLGLRYAVLPATGLEDALAGCPLLRDLDLYEARCGGVDGGIAAVMHQIAVAPIGTTLPLDLNLSDQKQLRPCDLATVAVGCPRLRVLKLDRCRLDTLPSEIGTHCHELEELHAHGTQFSQFPAEICTGCPKLRVLNLFYSAALTALPPAIVQLTQLDGALNKGRPTARTGQGRHFMYLENCKRLVAPPYSVVEGTRQEQTFAVVRDWFAQQEQEHGDDTADGGGGGE